MRSAVLGLALLCIPAVANAQTEPTYFGFRFGMTEAEARATVPDGVWMQLPAGTFEDANRVGLGGGEMRQIGPVGFLNGLEFVDGSLDRIIMISGGETRDADGCRQMLHSVVRALEPEFGAFAGAATPNEEMGDPVLHLTEVGSQIRSYSHPRVGSFGYANVLRVHFLQIESRYMRDRKPAGRPCFIQITVDREAPQDLRLPLRPAPTNEELAAAEVASRTVWVEEPDRQTFWRHYPVAALNAEITGRAVLRCLVDDDGGLRCQVEDETPEGLGFGNAARRVMGAFRMAQEIDGRDTNGLRVRVPVQFRFED